MDVLDSNANSFPKSTNTAFETFYWETYNEEGNFRKYVGIIGRTGLSLFDPYVDSLSENPAEEYVFEYQLSADFSYAVDGVRVIIVNSLGYPFYLKLDKNDNLVKEDLPMFVRDNSFGSEEPIKRTWKSLKNQNNTNPLGAGYDWEGIEYDSTLDLWDANHYYKNPDSLGSLDGYPKGAKVNTETDITIDNEPDFYYLDLLLKEFGGGGYPTAICTSGGRVFVGGTLESTSTIYFSKVLEGSSEI